MNDCPASFFFFFFYYQLTCLLFLFSPLLTQHPYDSGDLCNIDGTDMFVREVGLNSTMFVTWDGKRMYYPNNVLSQKPIHNVRRSPNMSEKIGKLPSIYFTVNMWGLYASHRLEVLTIVHNHLSLL